MALDASYLEAENNRLRTELEDAQLMVNALSVVKDPEQRIIPWNKIKLDLRISRLEDENEDLRRINKILAAKVVEQGSA